MRRRDFIAGVFGATAAWPRAGRAQPSAMPVISYLGAESPEKFALRLRAFKEGLGSRGFHEGKNVAIEYRWAEGRNDRLPGLAADLVRRGVAVVAAPGGVPGALAAKAATSTIPIVFEMGADPVAMGLVASLSRPGGNVTGVTSLNAEVAPKRLELLHELVPGATRFGVLVNPTNPKNAAATTSELEAAARRLGLGLAVLQASTEHDFEEVFAALVRTKAPLVIANETFFANRSEQLAALAVRHAVPAAHQSREFVTAGGLLGYGGSVVQSHSQAGIYTGRILQGEKPADLPVQQVTKVEMYINLRTAKALALDVPLSLVGRADEVFE